MREIFVFGSNPQGRHGKGAALEAVDKHGARYGQATGLQGNSYAIVTKELRKDWGEIELPYIHLQVSMLLLFAEEHSDWIFNVTPIGCGLAGFTPEQIAPMFNGYPDNVKLPEEFLDILKPT